MMKKFNVHKLILEFVVICFTASCGQTNKVFERVEFHADKESLQVLEFTNLVVDNQHIYIGARNRLYQLDGNLIKYFSAIKTGPVLDGIVCHKQKENEWTDNINKLILIDSDNDRIINCGSVEQGICELRQLGNIQNLLTTYNISDVSARQHVAASGNLSTVAFLTQLNGRKTFMFVGSSKTEKDAKSCGGYTKSFTISKRTLPLDNSSPDMFSTSNHEDDDLTDDVAIKMEKDFADKGYRITFVDGFSNGVTGYFIATHSSSMQSGSNFPGSSTYISQVCLEDPYMYSYLELPLECNVEGIRYTKAVASRTAKIGTLLRNHFNLQSTNDETAFDAVFISFKSENNEPGSAVCMFSLEEIERKFSKLVKRCMKYSASKPQSVPWIKDSSDLLCVGVSSLFISVVLQYANILSI